MSLDFETLVRRWRGPLSGWLAHRGSALGDLDEQVSEVFARAWMQREALATKLDSEARLGGWLVGIARNVQREARRRPRARPIEAAAGMPQPASADPLEAEEEARRVRRAIARLAPLDQALVLAFYFDGTQSAQVGRVFGLSPRAVEGRLRRSREKLREWLGFERTSQAR